MDETKQVITYAEPFSVMLTKGAKGEYRWEVKVRGSSVENVLHHLKALDDGLKKEYGEKEDKENADQKPE